MPLCFLTWGHWSLLLININGNDLSENIHDGLNYLVKGAEKPIEFEKIWDNSKEITTNPVSIWKVIPPLNHFALSDVVVSGYNKPSFDSGSSYCSSAMVRQTLWS